MQISSYRPVSYSPAVRAASVPLAPAAPVQATATPVNVPLPQSIKGSVVGDFLFGVKYGAQKIVEFIKHPLDESKREGPWRNPCLPETTAEKIGRWVPGALLAVAGFVIGKAVFRLPGGPNVGWR